MAGHGPFGPIGQTPDAYAAGAVTHHHYYSVPVTQMYRSESRLPRATYRSMGTQTEGVTQATPDLKTWRGWALHKARMLRPVLGWLGAACLFVLTRVNIGIPVKFGGR